MRNLPEVLRDELQEAGSQLGLLSVTVAPAQASPNHARFREWLARGYGGTMSYLDRQSARRADPQLIMPGVRSVITLCDGYYTEQLPQEIRADRSRGRIASYAWGEDYHELLLRKAEQLALLIQVHEPSAHTRCYVDTGPLAERELGVQSGAGFVGKNTLLIKPRAGSFFFLGELLTTAEIAATPRPQMPSCGSCTRCLEHCPTHAFPAAYVLNSNRCISYLTIEFRGVIPRELRAKMGNYVFGCDECQTCCPWNDRFSSGTADARYGAQLTRRAPPLQQLAALSREEYREFFRGSAVLRCRYEMLLRNVAVALGNWGSIEAAGILLSLARHDEPLVRAHAVWGLRQCDAAVAEPELQRLARHEKVAEVIAEFQ